MELERCLLSTLRINILGTGRELLRLTCTLQQTFPSGWRLDEVQRVVRLTEEDAAAYRNLMYGLNLIEKHRARRPHRHVSLLKGLEQHTGRLSGPTIPSRLVSKIKPWLVLLPVVFDYPIRNQMTTG